MKILNTEDFGRADTFVCVLLFIVLWKPEIPILRARALTNYSKKSRSFKKYAK